MAVLGSYTNTETDRWVDRSVGEDHLLYAVDPDNLDWNSFLLTIPPNILDGYVYHCSVMGSISATAVHEVDSTSLRESCHLQVLPVAEKRGARYVSEPICGMALQTGATANRWITEFRELVHHPIHVTRDWSLELLCPPAEDNVAHTGVYEVRVSLRQVYYAKR